LKNCRCPAPNPLLIFAVYPVNRELPVLIPLRKKGAVSMPEACIFCKIVTGEIPSELLYEDDDLIVFRDINPKAPVHILLVPRRHIRSINDLTDDDHTIVSKLIAAARDMAKREGIDASGYKLLFNVEKGGGQVIFHLHLHLIGGWE
jgi:histidine triad (HIT) family protein